MSIRERLAKLKLLIFDIDGVLVDVTHSYRLAIMKTVEFFSHKEVHFNEVQKLKNESGFNNDWDLTQELLKRKGLTPTREKIIDKFQSIYWNNGDGLIQGEKWLLDYEILKSLVKKHHLAIFTGRPRLEAEFVLQKNQVDQYFKPLVAMEDVIDGKPNPEGLISILKSYSLSSSEACYLGDTYDDLKASQRADVLPIAVIPPFGKEEFIEKFTQKGAYTVFKNVNEISNYF